MASRVPELIDALVARLTPDPELTGVVVVDGPEINETDTPDWLIVGWSGDPDGDFQAAQTLGGWSDLGTGREEQLQVTVAAIAARGDTDVRAARVRVFEIAGRVEALLRADPSVGLSSLEVAIEATQLVQEQDDNGAQATLLLTVAGRAFT
ncbi:hypothetical protein [Streptomyces sp. NPDC058665]|uniref:hypothetical protein n=1 Tax=Streptomyces sp. NPDC058665 TaxID=3346586 RepID=UPI00364FCE98